MSECVSGEVAGRGGGGPVASAEWGSGRVSE